MKKHISMITAVLLAAILLTGCAGSETNSTAVATSETEGSASTGEEKIALRLGGLKGPTSMGLVKLLSDAEAGNAALDYQYTIAGSADELTPLFVKGELDVLAIPANLGAILYNNTHGQVQALAVSTLGVIYITEKGGESIQNIRDLKGQTIYASGKGSTPEYALRYLLSQNGLDPEKDVTVLWKSEATEIVAQMAAEDHAIAMLPQPYVTSAQAQLTDLRIALDLTAIWDDTGDGSRFVTAALVVRKDYAEAHPEAVKTFLREYAASAAYINENITDGAALVEHFDIIKAAIAEKAIPYCNIVCITGGEMRSCLSGYLKILCDRNPKSVGGILPEEDFYAIYE